MPRKYRKRTPRQKAIDRNDALAREINKLLHDNKCADCGKPGETYQLHWSHVYSRRAKVIRWDEDNYTLHCYDCHQEWHSNPLSSAEKFNKRYPGRKQRLDEKLQGPREITLKKLLEIEEQQKARLSSLERIPR